ncbi:proteinral transcriptional corepressor ssn6 [Elsinoe australis]|uniref:Proteinral transcriptional corepressor ssn6 n=1 Tax=Elsinoe australis TaxID=40998 RepID=A0A2P8AID1_9PEZI|nr:proteinral transcriptional corepressor ssn6 [Elsinoe australis]
MRFLNLDSATGTVSLTKNFIGDSIPQYAMLSHTWGADDDEPDLRDIRDGTGVEKRGYEKLLFCGERATCDGLRYFWVDTCCIDASNNAEVSEAINSMYKWYAHAAKCYVYLSDVSKTDDPTDTSWTTAFLRSRWFTRGWTLQELLAPPVVEFYSKERRKCGTKKSLKRQISDITGIPVLAFEGSDLSDFSIAERIAWQEQRETKLQEDGAYSLLGICGVHMPPIYGEGKSNAFKRLRREIDTALRGANYDEFSVPFSLADVFDAEDFVAREGELHDIHASLTGDSRRRTVVLHGLGGIGKTQLAIAYAKKHRERYSAIFWLDASNDDSLKQSFSKIARQILHHHPSAVDISSVGTKNLDDIVDAVKKWLSLRDNTRWLIIYDNCDNPRLQKKHDSATVNIRDYFPESYQGSIIITTRSARLDIGHCLRISKLANIQDSLAILSTTSRRDDLTHDASAYKLAEMLDGLPLALATAGSYLRQAALDIEDYIRLYKASWALLQETSPSLNSYEDRTLCSTWQISMDRVRDQNPLSAQMLCLWAYFDNQDLWFELLRSGDAGNLAWIKDLTRNELYFHSTMRVLCDYGLVEIDLNSRGPLATKGYSIHSCVHSWASSVLNPDWDLDLAKFALLSTTSCMPSKDVAKWWVSQHRLIKHAARCYFFVANDLLPQTGIGWALHSLGDFYADQGKLAEAEIMYERALVMKEKDLGPEDMSTLKTVHKLGVVYRNKGKRLEAKRFYERALAGREKILGPDHVATLYIVSSLSILYRDLGQLDLSEQTYKRALTGFEKGLGPDHLSTLYTVNSMGVLYRQQGRFAEAEQLHKRALVGRQRAMGSDHTSTFDCFESLGILYREQGRFDEAEQMHKTSLDGRERALGMEHMITLDTVSNLGALYVRQGKLEVAEQMYTRALTGRAKTLGPEHPKTEMARVDLESVRGQRVDLESVRGQRVDSLVAHHSATPHRTPPC